MSTKLLWKTFMFLSLLTIVASALSRRRRQTTQSDKVSQSDKKFSDCIVGQSFAHKNTVGRVKMLICAEKINGVPRWQYTDGSSTFGEIFNPAKDCADIVDYLPDAKDGFYWIELNSKTKQKVWCDVHTDGGGFMLVGMKDSPKSWTVPSNFTPVDPLGPPHWSSVLGHINVLDFRVQFSTDKHFEETKADWMYRLQPQRQLGNLFSINNGCPYLQSGITNISFVKDLRTDTVITHNFKCSKFGQHVHHAFGWGKMNHCLRNVCKYGYGVLVHGVPIVIDKFGSYSYSAVSSFSGMNHNSTAFVGCDQGECCACFGPKGGRQNYCGPKCTSFNGGTVIKKAFVWFWVRTRMPTRLWERCMEFTTRNSAGKHEKHFIDAKTGTLHKGSCSKHLKTFLSEGTLTVSDKESFKKIPNVLGLLSYRTDTKKVYVNQGTHWKALSSEHELHKLQQKVKSEEKKVLNLENKIQTQETIIKNLVKEYQGLANRTDMLYPTSCSYLRKKHPSIPSGTYFVYLHEHSSSPLVQVHCDMTSKDGVGVTVIGHNSESRTYVSGYDLAGSYKRKITYDISLKQIDVIIKQSKKCEQFIKYECYHSHLWFPNSYYGWWVSRHGSKMNYWGGAAVNSGKCACGMTNSCAGGQSKCNCDKNDATWREDSGYLSDKNTLPVTELRFGDTTTFGGVNEKGYHTLGKLRCWG